MRPRSSSRTNSSRSTLASKKNARTGRKIGREIADKGNVWLNPWLLNSETSKIMRDDYYVRKRRKSGRRTR